MQQKCQIKSSAFILQGEQSVGYDMEGSDFELGWRISRIQPSRGERKKGRKASVYYKTRELVSF